MLIAITSPGRAEFGSQGREPLVADRTMMVEGKVSSGHGFGNPQAWRRAGFSRAVFATGFSRWVMVVFLSDEPASAGFLPVAKKSPAKAG